MYHFLKFTLSYNQSGGDGIRSLDSMSWFLMDFDNTNEIVKMTKKVYILCMGSYSTFQGNNVN